MQRVFLSYTYNPHPDHASEIDALERTVRRVIEAMDLRVVDGRYLGGRALEAEIRRRINESDALIALITPQADSDGHKVYPQFVDSEFQYARAGGKSTLRILHVNLDAHGLGAGDECVPFQPDKTLDVVMKLLPILAIWKKEGGRPVPIKIQPDHLARQFGDNHFDQCEYELMLDDTAPANPAQSAKLWPEPGDNAYVLVQNYVEGAKVRVRLTLNGETWRSPFVLPKMGVVPLTKDGD